MDLFIYSTTQLDRARVDLEDDLDAFLEGSGAVTGGGMGARGWNIDIELFDCADAEAAIVESLRRFLATWGVPTDTYLVLGPKTIPVFGSIQ